MTLAQLRHELASLAPADFILLLEKASLRDRAFLLAHPEYVLSPVILRKALGFLKRRTRHEPVAYILGEKEFYGRSFRVTRDTLIPRPETELLVETVLAHLQGRNEKTDIVDLGTGSGNIIVTLASELKKQKGLRFFASDLSSQALRVARKNAKRWKQEKRIYFLKSDLLESLRQKNILKSSFLLIVANLPYVSSKIFRTASKDVRAYEPKSAILSPKQGLAHYFQLLHQVREHCREKKVVLFLEISPEQTALLRKEVLKMFPKAKVGFLRDLTKRNRVAKVDLGLV